MGFRCTHHRDPEGRELLAISNGMVQAGRGQRMNEDVC